MKILKIISVFAFLIVISCDTIENPIKEQENMTCGDEEGPVPIRKILVEDFTGHKCPNCPDAAVKLEELIDMYCDHIIPIGIHVGYFAIPDDDFPADYRTTTGDELDANFSVTNQGLPNGLINRTEYEGDYVIGRDSWAAVTNLYYSLAPDFNIQIESEYSEPSGEITVDITVETYTQFDYDINLGLYVVEDSIVSAQKDGSVTVQDYVHMHVLRKGVNGAFGETIASSGINGDLFERSFTITAEDAWVLKNIGFVTFVSNESTREIIQAESEHLHLE